MQGRRRVTKLLLLGICLACAWQCQSSAFAQNTTFAPNTAFTPDAAFPTNTAAVSPNTSFPQNPVTVPQQPTVTQDTFGFPYNECVDGTPSAQSQNVAAFDAMPNGLLQNCDPCQIISPTWRWTFLPQGFLYHTYWASVAEPRLSTQAFRDHGGGSWLDSHIAGRLGIVRFGERYSDEGFQLDLLAGAKLRQDADNHLDMAGTDYRYDIPLTYRRGAHAWKFGYYHVSSHVGDEWWLKNPSFTRIDYYRDSLYLGYSFYATPEFRMYAEADYAFSYDFAEPWHFQFGFDWGPAHPTGIRGAPFAAMNVHLREELNFGGNINLQAGWAWRGEGLAAGTLRTGLFFYNGGSPQFTFYKDSEQQFGWGLWYDF